MSVGGAWVCIKVFALYVYEQVVKVACKSSERGCVHKDVCTYVYEVLVLCALLCA